MYHSIYDDFYWYTHFSDTTFVYGRALAQTAGTLVLRMADADVLPYDFAALPTPCIVYTDELKALLETKRTEAAHRKAGLDANAYQADDRSQAPYDSTAGARDSAVPELRAT